MSANGEALVEMVLEEAEAGANGARLVQVLVDVEVIGGGDGVGFLLLLFVELGEEVNEARVEDRVGDGEHGLEALGLVYVQIGLVDEERLDLVVVELLEDVTVGYDRVLLALVAQEEREALERDDELVGHVVLRPEVHRRGERALEGEALHRIDADHDVHVEYAIGRVEHLLRRVGRNERLAVAQKAVVRRSECVDQRELEREELVDAHVEQALVDETRHRAVAVRVALGQVLAALEVGLERAVAFERRLVVAPVGERAAALHDDAIE